MWEDYAKEIGVSTNDLTQAQKIQAEYNGIMEETRFQVGDAAAYTKTFSGQVQQLKFNFTQMTAAIGKVVAPIAQLFIPILNSAMQAVTNLFQSLQNVLKVFGLDMPDVVSKTSSAVSGVSADIENTGDSAVNAAKKINKAFAGVDEINVLKTSDSSSNNNTGTSNSGSSANISSPIAGNMDTSSVTSASENVIKSIEKIQNAFSSCQKFIKKHWDKIVAFFVSGAAAITTAFLGIKIAQFVSGISSLISSISAAGGIMSFLAGTIGAISAPVLAAVAAVAALVGIFTYLYMTSENFRNSVNEIINAFVVSLTPAINFITSTVIPNLINGFNNFMVIMQPLIDFVVGVLTDAWNKVLQPALMYIAETVVPTLTSTFENLWNNVLVPFGEFIGSVLEPVVKILTEAFEILWNNVLLPLCDFLGGVFSKAFEGVYEIYNETIIPIVNKVIGVFEWLWKNVLEPIVTFLWDNLQPAFETITETIGNVLTSLKTVFGGIIDFITGVFTGDWEKAWNGVKDIFSGIVDGLANIFKTPINLIIDGINAFIKGLNKIKIPDWVPLVGGKGFNIPTIPKLAQGGYFPANQPQLAIVGDNTREGEIVAPESKIYDQTRKAIRDSGGVGKQEIEITIYHKYEDGRTIIQKINQAQIDAGQVLILS